MCKTAFAEMHSNIAQNIEKYNSVYFRRQPHKLCQGHQSQSQAFLVCPCCRNIFFCFVVFFGSLDLKSCCTGSRIGGRGLEGHVLPVFSRGGIARLSNSALSFMLGFQNVGM